MPTKTLSSQTDNKGLQDLFSFGGGANTIFAYDDGISKYGYVIRSSGGDDQIFGSDFAGRPGGTGTQQDARTDMGDVLVGGDGADTIFGGAGNDTIYAGDENGNDAGKGQNAPGTNFIVGDGERQADNSLTADVSFTLSSTFTGGNDSLFGSQGFTLMRGDADIVTFSGDTFVGGNDTLTAGSGGSNMTGDARIIGGNGMITGGNDTLISGSGNDQMFGDWSSSAGFSGTQIGGSDTFVFLSVDHGFDSIGDFERGKDKIDLTATGVTFAMIDSNGNLVLDDGDIGVSGVAGGNTQICLTDVLNESEGSGGDLITINGVTGLDAADFGEMLV